MSNFLLKALINFAMLQTLLLTTSVGIATSIPASNGIFMTFLFCYMVSSLMTLIPAVSISLAFAYFQK